MRRAGRSCWSTSSRTPTRCSGRCSTGRSPAHATMVLIGDPKQAIYAFRGGDVTTYLQAAGTAATGRRCRSTGAATPPLLEPSSGCSPAPRSATSGSWSATSRPTTRAADWPARRAAPFRVRVVRRADVRQARQRHPHRRPGPAAHRARPRPRRHAAARVGSDVRGAADPARDIAVIALPPRRPGRRPRGAPGGRRPRGDRRRRQRVRHPGGGRVAEPARGARAAPPQPAGAGGRADLLLRPHRRSSSTRVATTSPTRSPTRSAGGPSCSPPAASPPSSRPPASRGLPARVLAEVGGERRLTDLRHIGEALARGRPSTERHGLVVAAGLAARAGRRGPGRPRRPNAPGASTPTPPPCSW